MFDLVAFLFRILMILFAFLKGCFKPLFDLVSVDLLWSGSFFVWLRLVRFLLALLLLHFLLGCRSETTTVRFNDDAVPGQKPPAK